MRILVTGSSGFVGSYLVPELIRKGHTVTALWHTNQPEFRNLSSVRCLQGSLLDTEFLNRATQDQDAVFHLAAFMLTQPQQKDTLLSTSVTGTENLVRSCQLNGVTRIIFTSSSVSIGASQDGKSLVTEDFRSEIPNWDEFLNVQAKRLAEEIIKNSTLNWNIVHSGLIYGPGDGKKKIRKANEPILKGRMPFYFSGGVSINPIENFVEGLLLVLEKGKSQEHYVLGGENISNKTLFHLLASSAKAKPPKWKFPNCVLRALGRLVSILNLKSALHTESVEMLLAYHWCDSSKAQRELGYRPGQAESAIMRSTHWILTNDAK